MQRVHWVPVLALVTAAFVCSAVVGRASAQTQTLFGSLSNFDCFNDTGQETHGFEIELDGLSSTDVIYTFGSPYQARYGTPSLVNFTGGVYVRYQSTYDVVSKVFKSSTPIPPSITPTAGHACWTGGSAGYLTSGCEHFGVSLARNATATKYRWLIADPLKPGSLKAFGTQVSIPAPVWTVVPPAVPGAAPIVQAAIPAPVSLEIPSSQFGDAIWVKTYETEAAEQVALDHLVTDDPAVPQEPVEIETEWEISQSNPGVPDGGALEHQKPLGDAKQSVVRRYEFYKFTGAYDPETHEVMCSGVVGGCSTPLPSDLGDYIGAQVAAIHISAAKPVVGVQITSTGFVYSRTTGTYLGTITVKNTSVLDAIGPLMMVFSSLPAGVAVVNPTGTFEGNSYLVIPAMGAPGTKLAQNQSVSFSVQFKATARISFTGNIYSGGM